MSTLYNNGTQIVIGDHITYGGKRGRVVFILDEGAFLEGFKSEDWAYLNEGIGIQLENGSIFCLQAPDEDLIPKKCSGE